jgi:hypothetical protein
VNPNGDQTGQGADADRVMAEFVALSREFPAWAVWRPRGGSNWVAVRAASARIPGPDMSLVWTEAATPAGLSDKMRRVDEQLTR